MPGPVEVWFWLWLSEGLCARLSTVHATYPGGTTLKYFSMMACGQSTCTELVASLLKNVRVFGAYLASVLAATAAASFIAKLDLINKVPEERL